jgi:predicted cupin superfamily sugar epimerase
MTAEEMVALLDLAPHPEGGWFRETFRDASGGGRDEGEGRATSTAIYYLLAAGQVSAWHRVDAAEVWHFYAGSPLALSLSDGQTHDAHWLGQDLAAGEQPQVIVPPGIWQSARSLGDWTLVGCTVAPGFEFSGFEMAPPGWAPQRPPAT